MTRNAPPSGEDATPMMVRVIVRTQEPPRRTDQIPLGALLAQLEDAYQIYVWPTTTMRAACAQLHAARPISEPLTKHTIRVFSYDDRTGIRWRRTLSDVTRVPESNVMQLLGGADDPIAQAIMPAYDADKEKDKDKAPSDAAVTFDQLQLSDGDFLECIMHMAPPKRLPPPQQTARDSRSGRPPARDWRA